MILRRMSTLAAVAAASLMPWPALADNGLDRGDTAWILTATALVLMMTLPGLALFYGGLVQARNLLSVLMHCCVIGASLLWVGWFGFNGGSALAADGGAAMAIVVTHLSAAAASLTWAGLEWLRFGKPSLVGLVTGTIAGLASVTPASGFIGPVGGVLIGIAGGAVCFYAVALIKFRLKIDDSLDVFAVHGVGGILGTLGVAFLALPTFGGLGLAEGAGAR